MSEVEKLKSFVAARLNEAASEIMAAFARTLLDYEKEVARLKEENMRHSSLVEIILKKKLPEKTASCVSESAIVEVSANPGSNPTAKTSDAGRSALDSEMYQKVKKITCKPKTGKITAFISKEQFLKFSAGKKCLFCVKEVAATEHHLLKRHYNIAVHFIRDGIARFVIPCLCSAKIQERSHWHCPCCQEIITRRCHFGMHIWRKHGYPVLRPNPETGNHRPSSNEANSSGHEGLHREEFNSQKPQQRRASLLLQKKERAEKGKITAFISKEQFLKFSAGKNCLFCFKEVAATEHHLLKRHYNLALHFLRDGIERFVIPCMCSEKIQKRSHWHCPCCHDILTRRCPFQDHIWKKHGYSVLKPNRVTG
ncbi:uncharacterized protein LOC119785828 [Cyprinodon tularosa]|uniref:uncharacterized protein LOC119785828 n=1 Tax=Cyprinodon tularosa TaxID=77115 RepID=UPI0018E21C55|nr:uncharacterized protein LOC119785828 [Cyprinodon tularosa]